MSEDVLLAAAINRLERIKRRNCFDPFNLESKPIPKQQDVLNDLESVMCRYLVAANQTGKSQLGAREVAWIFEKNHPFVDLEAMWGDRPLTLLVIGQTTKNLHTEIWERKIRPYLDPSSYKATIIGGALQYVKHVENGNQIIFQSHSNLTEARKNIQGYVAQYVWLDEMPDSISLFGELVTRIIATGGRFLCTFTPLIRNVEIKNMIEAADGEKSKRYNLNMLDNPVYYGREEQILAQFAHLPEAERNARLYGKWYMGDRAVYYLNEDNHVAKPDNYSMMWRHMEVVDPAASGIMGYTLWAEDPSTHIWYCVFEKYIKGEAATDLLDIIDTISAPYNVQLRRSDPHEVWFLKEAAKRGKYYEGVFDKNSRKHELIKGLQEALNDGKIKLTPGLELLKQEMATCQWSETKDGKIVGSSRFHLLDCAQYFADNIPKPLKEVKPVSFEHALRIQHKKKVQAQRASEAKRDISKGGRIKKSNPRLKRGRARGAW